MAKINPTAISQKIKGIIEKYNLLLKYSVLGPSALTRAQIKFLVKSGLLQPHHIKFNLGDVYLQSHLDALRRKSRKSVRDFTIKHLRSSAGMFIDRFMDKQATDLGSIVQNDLLASLSQLRDKVQDEISEGVIRNQSAQEIARRLREKTQDLNKDWERVVTTELARAQNLGNFDAIIENNIDKAHDEIYVYKTGPHDAKTCKWCLKFWFLPGGVTPKVYKMSDLVANGSNIGKKAADWQPTVDNTHPNERHFLMELPHGFGFRGGSLSFIGKDHIEHKVQKG